MFSTITRIGQLHHVGRESLFKIVCSQTHRSESDRLMPSKWFIKCIRPFFTRVPEIGRASGSQLFFSNIRNGCISQLLSDHVGEKRKRRWFRVYQRLFYQKTTWIEATFLWSPSALDQPSEKDVWGRNEIDERTSFFSPRKENSVPEWDYWIKARIER